MLRYIIKVTRTQETGVEQTGLMGNRVFNPIRLTKEATSAKRAIAQVIVTKHNKPDKSP